MESHNQPQKQCFINTTMGEDENVDDGTMMINTVGNKKRLRRESPQRD